MLMLDLGTVVVTVVASGIAGGCIGGTGTLV